MRKIFTRTQLLCTPLKVEDIVNISVHLLALRKLLLLLCNHRQHKVGHRSGAGVPYWVEQVTYKL